MVSFGFSSLLLLAIGCQLGFAESSVDSLRAVNYYYPEDDASWAIHTANVTTVIGKHTQQLYHDFIANCHKEVAKHKEEHPEMCVENEQYRMFMNKNQPPGVYNYTKKGFAKIKAPRKLFNMVAKFYKNNIGNEKNEWGQLTTYHNLWDSAPTVTLLSEPENEGGGVDLMNELFAEAKKVVEEWTGQELRPVSLYGIRLYHNGSILAPHVDRMPLISSAIINVDQDVNEPWPLEVYGHDGVATNVTMEPGDMVLYESHSVIHGRPFPLNGKYYANIFVHFEPLGPKDEALEYYDPKLDLPPYVIPDGQWIEQWRKEHKNGWYEETFDPHKAADTGDLIVLETIGDSYPGDLEERDKLGWQALHRTVRMGHLDAVDLLLDYEVDINSLTYDGASALTIAREFLRENHPVTKFLIENGAIDPMEEEEL